MGEERAEQERRAFNRLAAIKLALQILDRRTPLSPAQRALVGTAIDAVDDLAEHLVRRYERAPRAHDLELRRWSGRRGARS
jgi:hypothetical protein